ncbi:hypothetical protein F2P56_030443 [Juglans regia]|uniref:Uncharacterized protein LOC109013596 n=2 Tax=Juglans regia TaxID=51240 RepID=A0A2I4H562_JUGRE|nr:uncharacterized protein LOC109013596 [Juglans regia]KAF5450064.1 hypothetical protein F2P56_030443 [Juglans regia]
MDPTERVSVEESMGMFCLLVGHAQGQRIVGDRFQHSSETINRHVKKVMCALHQLGRIVIRRTDIDGVHPYIAGNPHNYPWFEKCLGAMDSTMIDAAAPSRLSNAYRNHRGRIAQNVLCLCDFDMKFTYVYTGWEGTAHDARLFLDASSRSRNQFPWPPEGYYYLVDSAFPCIEKFMPPYPQERQGMLVTACCTLHNLIKTVTPNDEFIQAALELQFSEENMTGADNDAGETSEVVDMSHESASTMIAQRDGIAIPMWADRFGE